MSNTIYELQLQDDFTGESIISAGGICTVVQAGTSKKVTLLDPANGFAPLANPFIPVRGHITFAVPNINGITPAAATVDVYGMTPAGRPFRVVNAKVGNPTEVAVDSNRRTNTVLIPIDVTDYTPNVEGDTGFDLPLNCLVTQPVALMVGTADPAQTASVGLLSSQTGGNATGFITGISVGAVGVAKASLANSTIGALLRVTSGSTQVPESAAITTARRVSWTPSAGSALFNGFIMIPYQMAAG